MAEEAGRRPARRVRDDAAGERALDRLADPTPSRVGVDGARRARDVSAPTAEDLASAAEEVVVRRARPVDGPR